MSAKKKEIEEVSGPPIVINTTQGPRIIPFGGVSNGGIGIIDMERMKFHAGLNAPKDPDEFAKVSSLPSYKQWVKDGVLQEISDVSEIITLGDLDEKIIESSASRTSMEWWLANEERSSVCKKLKVKIAEMRAPRPGNDE